MSLHRFVLSNEEVTLSGALYRLVSLIGYDHTSLLSNEETTLSGALYRLATASDGHEAGPEIVPEFVPRASLLGKYGL